MASNAYPNRKRSYPEREQCSEDVRDALMSLDDESFGVDWIDRKGHRHAIRRGVLALYDYTTALDCSGLSTRISNGY